MSLLAVIGTILHFVLIKSLFSLDKSWTLTHKLIILREVFAYKGSSDRHIRNLFISSAFQTIYLTVIAIPELIHLATQGKIPELRTQRRIERLGLLESRKGLPVRHGKILLYLNWNRLDYFRMVLWESGVQDLLNNENDKLWNLN